MKSAAFTLLAVVLTANQVFGAKQKNQVADEDGPPCGYRIIKRLENCCAFPDLISTDIFAGCHEELKDTTPQEEGGMETATLRPKKSKKSGKARKTRATYKVGWGGGRSMGTYRGGRKSIGQAMCIYECVLRNQTLHNSEGEIDVSKMEKKFIEASPTEWKPIVKAAIGSCASQYSKVKQSSLPKPIISLTGTSCRYGPALFMSCLRGYLTMNCEKNSILAIDNTCKDKIDFLNKCNPFKVRGSSGGGNKYWGAVEAEDTASVNKILNDANREQNVAPAQEASAFAKASPEIKSLYNVFG